MFFSILYAYSYFCMPFYTPYAKRKCKTEMQNDPPPSIEDGGLLYTTQNRSTNSSEQSHISVTTP